MSKIKWDAVGERFYETGVDHGVLYPAVNGEYPKGVPWNGLTTVTESPSGAEASPQYADNIKYLNLVSAEEFGGSIEAFYSPKEFDACDGSASPVPGISIGQQNRQLFGFSYRTKLGNDTDGQDFAYKIQLIYGALAAPSERAHATVNDSPEATALSWDITTTPVEVPGFKPSATLTINSNEVDAAALAALEDILYGTDGTEPRLPLPEEIFALFAGTVNTVETVAPTQAGNVLTIPGTAGVVYRVDGKPVSGTVNITKDTVVTARPAEGYTFTQTSDSDWTFKYNAG